MPHPGDTRRELSVAGRQETPTARCGNDLTRTNPAGATPAGYELKEPVDLVLHNSAAPRYTIHPPFRGQQVGCGTAVRRDRHGLRAAEPDRDFKPAVRELDRSSGERAADRRRSGSFNASLPHPGNPRRELSVAGRQETPTARWGNDLTRTKLRRSNAGRVRTEGTR